jgi:hypothetical protein
MGAERPFQVQNRAKKDLMDKEFISPGINIRRMAACPCRCSFISLRWKEERSCWFDGAVTRTWRRREADLDEMATHNGAEAVNAAHLIWRSFWSPKGALVIARYLSKALHELVTKTLSSGMLHGPFIVLGRDTLYRSYCSSLSLIQFNLFFFLNHIHFGFLFGLSIGQRTLGI